MQDLVISDTSCLIVLTKIGQVDLLQKTYGSVLVPSEVLFEYERRSTKALPVWIQIVEPRPESIVRFEIPSLDPGEQAAFALASEHPGALLIVDEKTARNIAKRLGFRTTGTLGVLLAAKADGNVIAIKPLLDQILETDFYLSEEVVRQTLRDAGEL